MVKIIQCTVAVYTNEVQRLGSAKLYLPLPGGTASVSGRTGFQPTKLQKQLQLLQTWLNRAGEKAKAGAHRLIGHHQFYRSEETSIIRPTTISFETMEQQNTDAVSWRVVSILHLLELTEYLFLFYIY